LDFQQVGRRYQVIKGVVPEAAQGFSDHLLSPTEEKQAMGAAFGASMFPMQNISQEIGPSQENAEWFTADIPNVTKQQLQLLADGKSFLYIFIVIKYGDEVSGKMNVSETCAYYTKVLVVSFNCQIGSRVYARLAYTIQQVEAIGLIICGSSASAEDCYLWPHDERGALRATPRAALCEPGLISSWRLYAVFMGVPAALYGRCRRALCARAHRATRTGVSRPIRVTPPHASSHRPQTRPDDRATTPSREYGERD
jgi:hypothetical protein